MSIVRVDSLRTIAAAGISGTYTAVGTSLTFNWRMMCFNNNTQGNLLISFDGINDNIFVAAGGFKLYDLSTNSPPVGQTDSLVLQIGTQFYVKSISAPVSGSLYIEGIYAQGGI